jgi:hypothetical protein
MAIYDIDPTASLSWPSNHGKRSRGLRSSNGSVRYLGAFLNRDTKPTDIKFFKISDAGYNKGKGA